MGGGGHFTEVSTERWSYSSSQISWLHEYEKLPRRREAPADWKLQQTGSLVVEGRLQKTVSFSGQEVPVEQKLQRTGSFSGQEALANWKLQRAGSFSGLRELLEEESVQVPLEDDILDILEDQPEVSNEHQIFSSA